MLKRKHALGMVAGVMMIMSGSVSATTLTKLNFDEIIQDASICIIGEVINVQYEQTQNGVFTLTTFEVKKAAFGAPGNTVTVRTPGGRLNGGKISMGEVNAGAPRFFSGSESLLLLKANAAETHYSVVGYSQGFFPVVDNAQGSIVQLPESAGGTIQVDEALDMIRIRRTTGNSDDIAQ